MKPKKTIISILLLVAILPATVYAQASLYKLPKGERSMGIRYGVPDVSVYNFTDFNIDFDGHEIWGYIEHGFTDKLKGGALLDIAFDPADDLGDLSTQFSGMFHLIYIDAIGPTFLDYFFMGAAGGTYGFRSWSRRYLVKHGYEYRNRWYTYYFDGADAGLQSVNFITGGGLIANLGPIKPFVYYVFAHSRTFLPLYSSNYPSYNLVEHPEIRGVSTEGLSFGVEFDISERIRLFVRVYRKLYNRKSLVDDPTLGIGIDFH